MQARLSKLLMIFAFGAAALQLSAQQSIIITQPADANHKSGSGNSDSILPDSSPDHSDQMIRAGDYDAPHQFFQNSSPSLPVPPPMYFENQNPAAAAEAEKRRNWTLLTPSEILGVQTPEDILGIKDKKNQNLSLDQQFLLRLSNTGANGATNNASDSINWSDNNNNNDPFNRNSSSSWASSFGKGYNNNGSPGLSPGQMANAQQPDKMADLSQLFNQQGSSSANQQGLDSIWTSRFAKPSQTQFKTSQAQLNAMERFRALMEPGSSSEPEKVMTQTRYSTHTKSDSSSPSFFQQQPQYNPAGSSIDQLLDNSARPTGIQPLSGVSTPRLKTETTRPSWQAQLPPWMRKGPPTH